MKAEFDFYVKGNLDDAISTLEEALKLNPNNYFAYRALLEIYIRNEMNSNAEALIQNHAQLNEDEY